MTSINQIVEFLEHFKGSNSDTLYYLGRVKDSLLFTSERNPQKQGQLISEIQTLAAMHQIGGKPTLLGTFNGDSVYIFVTTDADGDLTNPVTERDKAEFYDRVNETKLRLFVDRLKGLLHPDRQKHVTCKEDLFSELEKLVVDSQQRVEKAEIAARVLCPRHFGVEQPLGCPVCRLESNTCPNCLSQRLVTFHDTDTVRWKCRNCGQFRPTDITQEICKLIPEKLRKEIKSPTDLVEILKNQLRISDSIRKLINE